MEPSRAVSAVLVAAAPSPAQDLVHALRACVGGAEVAVLSPRELSERPSLPPWGLVCMDARGPAPWLEGALRSVRERDAAVPIVVVLPPNSERELDALAWGADECTEGNASAMAGAVAKARRRREQAAQAAQALREEHEQAQQQRLRRHNEVLQALAKQLASDDLKTGLKAITEAAASSLEVTSVSVWLFDRDGGQLTVEDQFDTRTGEHTDGVSLSAHENQEYFQALQDERVISASDVRSHPALRTLWQQYLAPRGIMSLLDAPIRAGDRLLGVLCHEQADTPRAFSVEDLALAGSFADFVALAIESHEHRKAEAALLRSKAQLEDARRIEAVGRLAGGVAHDFNNVITVVSSYAFLLARKLDKNDPLQGPVAEIGKAAERAADITRKLLALSRRDPVAPRVLDLNAVIRGMETFIRRLIGEHIQLQITLSNEPLLIRADPGQVEQVVLNLVVNARDAANPEGSSIEVRTAREANPHSLVERPCVLEVRDNGIGMPPEVKARIFEPFFTTKDVGKGSGLGLFTVWGTVTQMGGTIEVQSEPHKGSCFTLRFAEASPETGPLVSAPERSELMGSETVLLVEDEAQVREVTALILKDLGYRVLVAENIDQAVAHARENPHIDLLVSDIVMPRASGPVVAARLKELIPSLRVLFISGYSKDMLSAYDASLGPTLPKPFTVEQIGKKVRDLLDPSRNGKRPPSLRP